MTLQSSGAISLANVNTELGNSSNSSITMPSTTIRSLTGISSGPITLPTDFYGKSLAFVYNATIASDTANYDMYADAVAVGWNQTAPLRMTVTVNSGVNVYSNSVGSYAFSTNTGFPSGTILTLINYGNIVGRGGDGGTGGGPRSAGSGGGSAGPGLYAGYTITVYNYGAISGGGGGGGGGGSG
jgi:hypothetical protein